MLYKDKEDSRELVHVQCVQRQRNYESLMYLHLKYIKRRNQLSTTKQTCSATTCSEVCLEELSLCVKCSCWAAPSLSMKAERFYADFNRTQRNRCACIPQLDQGEMGMHSRFCLFVCFLTPYLYVFVVSFGPWSSSSFDKSYGSPVWCCKDAT